MKQAQWISPFSMKDHWIEETLFCSLWQFDLDKGPCVHNADPDLLSMFPRRKFVSMTTDLCILRCSRKILCEGLIIFFILQKSVFSVLLLVLDSYDIQPFKGSNRTVDGSLEGFRIQLVFKLKITNNCQLVMSIFSWFETLKFRNLTRILTAYSIA